MRKLLILRILLSIEWQTLPAIFFGRYQRRKPPRTSNSKTAACMVEYMPSVYVIISTKDCLYLDKEAEMACETSLEGDKLSVDTSSEVNLKSRVG